MNTTKELIGKLEKELTDCLKKEIGLMREVLANMHQEELALVMFDRKSWTQTLQERFPLMQRLSALRVTRQTTTKHMEQMLTPDPYRQKIPLEQILPQVSTEDCELSYLSEQLHALLQRMNLQHTKNESLMKNYEIFCHAPSHFTQGIPLQQGQTKKPGRKPAVATYPREKP